METSRREPEPRSWTARILAPLALVATIAAAVLVISGSLGDSEQENGSDKGGKGANGECTEEGRQALENGYYVVTEEDVEGLSGIAVKVCLPVERLERLNPNLDPQTLQVANCVDLVRDGCKALAED